MMRTKISIAESSAEIGRLLDDLFEIVDRIRASKQMVEESRRLLNSVVGQQLQSSSGSRPEGV